jgi:hypothetical protein
MLRMLTVATFALSCATAVAQAISASEAAKHMGEQATVCGGSLESTLQLAAGESHIHKARQALSKPIVHFARVG